MGRVYTAVTPEADPGSAAQTAVLVMGVAEKPIRLLRWWVTAATTTSAWVEMHVLRVTGDTATGTDLTPAPLEQGGQAYGGDAWSYPDNEPTAGTIIYRYHINLLAGREVVYREHEQIWVPGATNEGFAIEFIDDPNEVCIVGAVFEQMG